MKPVVDAFSFTFSFPGMDEDFVFLVYDVLKDKEDSYFRVSMDVDGKIHVSVRPLQNSVSNGESLSERASAVADFVYKRMNEAVDVASRRYKLYKELSRIEYALSEAKAAAVLEDLVPSVW